MKRKIDHSFENRARILGLNHLMGYDHCRLGYYLFEKKLYDGSKIEFLKSVKINPKLGEAWLGLAKIAQHTGEIIERDNALQKALSCKSKSPSSLYRLAVFFEEISGIEIEKELLKKVVLLDSDGEWGREARKRLTILSP